MIKRICQRCEKEFYTYKCRIDNKKDKANYCSRKCHFEAMKKLKPIKCFVCKKKFNPVHSKIKFCSRKCYYSYRKGQIITSKTVPCSWCEKPTRRNQLEIKKNNTGNFFCSQKCFGQWREKFAPHGKDHPSWTGGKYQALFNAYSDGWKAIRRKIIKRDNKKCRICGKSPPRLEVHHIKPLRKCKLIEEANNLENLLLVCVKCHRKLDKK